ncbi:hypothetical protein RRG08_057200 [Elysia crispata]|uniref:Uncharacterized protein n=1 Tax=Elysia crispata TaxID=231223 RepID=A0AAE0XWD6_9GAST|nr:hypothetical protein RRG08_057200 [Elysia crispata]
MFELDTLTSSVQWRSWWQEDTSITMEINFIPATAQSEFAHSRSKVMSLSPGIQSRSLNFECQREWELMPVCKVRLVQAPGAVSLCVHTAVLFGEFRVFGQGVCRLLSRLRGRSVHARNAPNGTVVDSFRFFDTGILCGRNQDG